jgi:hypothetical protein
MTAAELATLDLPQLFTPVQAAEILRGLGLTEITECALRTRAYRRQVPFHLNGRRIRFTAGDLRDIIEGHAQRPSPPSLPKPEPSAGRPTPRRAPRTAERPDRAWRAREQRGSSASGRA